MMLSANVCHMCTTVFMPHYW